ITRCSKGRAAACALALTRCRTGPHCMNTIGWWPSFRATVDECHHLSAHSFELVVRQARAKYITGLMRHNAVIHQRTMGEDVPVRTAYANLHHTEVRMQVRMYGASFSAGER